MEIKIKVNKDLDVQGLNVQLISQISCEQDTSSVVEYQQQMQDVLSKADAHWQRQLDVMEHTMKVLQRRMDAFRKNHPDF